ncbi:MAG: CotH kinase family protein [Prevotellaceae bacterium]|nr:CotH kinase family protein [Prevotellaceae bacterium]
MKKLTYLFLFLITSLMGYAQQWIDMTDMYVINPRYDNNDRTTGWSGTELSAEGPKENAEHWNRNYNTYQMIAGLPAGKYRLSLDAFYRMGTSPDDYSLYSSEDYASSQHAKLYAETSIGYYNTSLAPLSSAALSRSLGGRVFYVEGNEWWGGKCVPDNMEAAYYWFEAGYYNNSLECEVGNDGVLTIGIRKDYLIREDWTCIDNWKLEYWGTVTKVTSIILSNASLSLVPSETYYLTADVQPSNATYRNVSWTSTNESVAKVDSKGCVTAVGAGSCYITATAVDGSNKTAQCRVTVTNNIPSANNIIINEIMAANVDVYLDPSQNYGSWVELYNPTNKGVSLGGLYISDDPSNLKKHRLIDSYGVVPANGYALLNFDHHEVWTEASYRQIDDKLDCDGGVIIISDGKTIIAQQSYPEAISRASYARTTDGGSEWSFTGNPSPASSNQASGGFATKQLEAPAVDKDAQLFTGTMQVCVNIPTGATLRYTIDGTAPTLTNGYTSLTGIFNVSETTNYRFRLFQDGYLPSTVVTRTYINNNNRYPFPIISVVTDRNHIYDKEIGVFGEGQYGRPGNGQSGKCNWNMDWDRPVSFEYITTDNECIISQECNFAMCGGWSRAWSPHSFKLKADKAYDLQNFFGAQFFAEKPYLKHKTLQIRNGGNDTGCRIKDPALQQVVARSGLNVEYQSWQPVHVFINGNHYAVLNMREPNNKHYAYANYGIDTDEMDQFEMSPDSGYVQMTGTDESFLRLMELSENAADEDTYEEICKLLDVDEYANYMAVELYLGGTDWPQNNVKGFRDVNDGKFRFVLFDLDGALSTRTPFNSFFNKRYYYFDTLHGYNYSTNESIEGNHNYSEIKLVALFENLLKNDTFRKKFIDTYCIVGGSVFQPKYVSSIVGEMRDYLSQGYYVYPSSTANSIISTLTSSYNSNLVDQLKNCSNMNLSSVGKQRVSLSSNVDGAKIKVNDIELPYTEFDGYLFAPITLKASAPAGYRFVGWTSDASTSLKTIFDKGSTWKYYDQGSLDSENWTSSSYSDTRWSSGEAIIGYDYNYQHPDIVTETRGNLPCYYFRKSFTIDSTPASTDQFILDYTIDDGMVVYVNGVEAGRYNMPSGATSYDTFASTYAQGNPDTGTMTIAGSFFKKGANVIAVEVHNNSLSSTDIMWDASLSAVVQNTSGNDYVSTDEEYILPTSGTQTLTAIFEEISEDELLAEGITPVRINEVSASNSIYVNDYFKKNDWIELYNTTSADIDIAGMYISDNANKPEKYQVPSNDVRLNTVIPAHGYKVIWCDKLDNIGADIHTSFKLAAEGGDVLITTATYADTLTYAEHLGTQTFGRYPDGANDCYVMNIPTIGKANLIGSYDTLYVAPIVPDEPNAIHNTYSKQGGITIAYVDGVVNVKSEDAPIIGVSIYSTSGMKIAAAPMMRANERFATVNVATLPKGVYVASAVTEAGDECRIKFIIR